MFLYQSENSLTIESVLDLLLGRGTSVQVLEGGELTRTIKSNSSAVKDAKTQGKKTGVTLGGLD